MHPANAQKAIRSQLYQAAFDFLVNLPRKDLCTGFGPFRFRLSVRVNKKGFPGGKL